MSKNKYRANSTDIWKRPLNIRYIGYIQTENGDYVGTTWQSLYQSVKDRGKVEKIKLIDIHVNKVMDLTEKEFSIFLEAWRDNYHNSEWNYEE